MLRKKDDALLKGAIEDGFPYLLRFFFKDADTIFDMQRGFVFLDKEMRELFPERKNGGGARVVDMLVKVFLMDGREEWMLLHLEIQGRHKKDFGHRMFRYYYRIYDRHGVNIAAMAIFTGRQGQQQPGLFTKEFLGTEIRYKYNVYHILDHTEAELLAMNNPFALIMLAAQKALLEKKVPEEELGAHRLTVAKALIKSKKYGHEQIASFIVFLKNFLYIESPEINSKFEKQINSLTGKKNPMSIIEYLKTQAKVEGRQEGLQEGRQEGLQEGLQEGRQEGLQEGRTESREAFVKSLLLNTDFSLAKIASLVGVSPAFVSKIKKSLR